MRRWTRVVGVAAFADRAIGDDHAHLAAQERRWWGLAQTICGARHSLAHRSPAMPLRVSVAKLLRRVQVIESLVNKILILRSRRQKYSSEQGAKPAGANSGHGRLAMHTMILRCVRSWRFQRRCFRKT
jgi:hypothetical protein